MHCAASKQPSQEILDHQAKRKVELKLMEFRLAMEVRPKCPPVFSHAGGIVVLLSSSSLLERMFVLLGVFCCGLQASFGEVI